MTVCGTGVYCETVESVVSIAAPHTDAGYPDGVRVSDDLIFGDTRHRFRAVKYRFPRFPSAERKLRRGT